MEIETTTCPKCFRRGCWTEEESHEQPAESYPDEIWHDYTCKCGHTITEQEENSILKTYRTRIEAAFDVKKFDDLLSHIREPWLSRLYLHARKNEHREIGFIICLLYQKKIDDLAEELRSDEEFEKEEAHLRSFP
jgi:hypothetical protein